MRILSSGGDSTETRTWDEKREITLSMRSKESAPDYRYFPEPDIPWLAIDTEWVEKLRHPNRNWLMRNGNAIERILA